MNSSSLVDRVVKVIRSDRLVAPGDRVLVGISGGPDSVALAHVLSTISSSLQIELLLVHVDHQLRSTSAVDAEGVSQFAKQLGLPVEIVTRNVRQETAGRGWSLEDAARRVRYQAFRETAQRHGAQRLVLGHTADDQAETVLMRLIRGAGLTGLTGIPQTRRLGDLVVIRPLLRIRRDEIMAYLQDHHLSYCEDATNQDPSFLRNRIRAQLVPLLERDYNLQIKTLCCQLAEQCQVDGGYIQRSAARTWRRLVKSHGSSLLIRKEPFVRQPEAIQRALLRLAIQHLQGDLTGFEFRHWLEAQRLVTERPVGTVLDLPGSVQLQRTKDHVIVRLKPLPSSTNHDILLRKRT